MSLTQDLSWSLGRSIALQLQRQTDLLHCTINCFLQWDHLPNMAVGDLAFYYTLYLWNAKEIEMGTTAESLELRFRLYLTFTLQVLLGCGNKKKMINCWVCLEISCPNSYLFLPKICTFLKNLINELKCGHENEVRAGDGKQKSTLRGSSVASPICQEGQSERTFPIFLDFFPILSLSRGTFCPPCPFTGYATVARP